MQDIKDLELKLQAKEEELRRTKEEVRLKDLSLMEREAELNAKHDSLEIRSGNLDDLLDTEQTHFNQRLDRLRTQLDAANEEYARLDMLLANGTSDREDKISDMVDSQRARLKVLIESKEKELVLFKKTVGLLGELIQAKIEPTEQQCEDQLKPRLHAAKDTCKNAKKQTKKARKELRSERRRVRKLRQRLWELQGMEGELKGSDSDSGWEFGCGCGKKESSSSSSSSSSDSDKEDHKEEKEEKEEKEKPAEKDELAEKQEPAASEKPGLPEGCTDYTVQDGELVASEGEGSWRCAGSCKVGFGFELTQDVDG